MTFWRRYWLLMGIGLCFLGTIPTWCEESSATILPATPTYAALFKNGIGLMVGSVELPSANGTYQMSPLPDATLGSFWLSWDEGLSLDNIKATQVQTMKSIPASTLPEILEANIGNEVELLLRDVSVWFHCTILDIPQHHDDPILPLLQEKVIPIPPPQGRGDLVLVQGPANQEAIPLGDIKSVRFLPEKEKRTIDRPQMENVVQFDVAGNPNSASREVAMTYLAKGIAWSPSYVVDISQEKEASFSAKAVIVNDLLPLENTDVELIAGYPLIAYSETPTAFSLAPLQQVLEQMKTSERLGRRMRAGVDVTSNRMAPLTTQIAGYGMMDAAAPMPSMPDMPVEGEGSEDLYFYKVDQVTLKQGERGYYPLFNGKVPFEHIYTWEIPNYIDDNMGYRSPQPDQPPAQQVVWHALKLTNTTGSPWTTAPAMTMKNGRILGQDTINYTPNGATTQLKITQAVSIHAEQNEYETDRQRSAAQFYNRNYDLVTVTGELAVTNFKDEPVSIEITKMVSGEVKTTDGEAKINRLAKGLRSVNPDSQIIWKVNVKPGKDNTMRLKYTCQVYVQG